MFLKILKGSLFFTALLLGAESIKATENEEEETLFESSETSNSTSTRPEETDTFASSEDELADKLLFQGFEAKSLEEQKQYFQQAAEKGSGYGALMFGMILDEEAKTEDECKEVIKWYMRASEKGVSSADVLIGAFYRDGEVIARDFQEAMKWYLLASSRGNGLASYYIGHMYKDGEGVPADEKEAQKWYALATEQGYTPNQTPLEEDQA